MKKWVIYKITNPSGRIYIGKSCDFNSRKSAYKNLTGAIKTQRIIYNSLLKYGYINHIIQIIEEFDGNGEMAAEQEIFWIKELKTNHNKWPNGNGMNLTDGGEGATGVKHSIEAIEKRASKRRGVRMAEETKIFLSQYNKNNPTRGMLGKNHSEEAKMKMSKSKKGKPNIWAKGRKVSEEVRIKNSIAHLGQKAWNKGRSIWSEEDRKRIGLSKIGNTNSKGIKHSIESIEKFKLSKLEKSKIVQQFDLSGNFIREYQSKREAGRSSGISRNSINEILNGTTKNPKSFIFKYKG